MLAKVECKNIKKYKKGGKAEEELKSQKKLEQKMKR
jgi:hypothetical protein